MILLSYSMATTKIRCHKRNPSNNNNKQLLFGTLWGAAKRREGVSKGGCSPLRSWKIFDFVNEFCAIWSTETIISHFNNSSSWALLCLWCQLLFMVLNHFLFLLLLNHVLYFVIVIKVVYFENRVDWLIDLLSARYKWEHSLWCREPPYPGTAERF